MSSHPLLQPSSIVTQILGHDRIDGAMHPHRDFETVTFMLEGNDMTIDGQRIQAFETAVINSAHSELKIHHSVGQLLWLSGVQLGEPVAMGGPFVMNTKAEILQAFKDHQASEF